MREDSEYLPYIDDLVREHRELEEFLAALDREDPAQREEFVRSVEELHHRIAMEKDSLFPASLTALSGEQWDRAMAAWHTAHGS
jgi:predicted HAD superfamily phosphohydrolase